MPCWSPGTRCARTGLPSCWGRGRRPTTCDGTPATASARLTTGNTLIWGTRQVALRLEGNLGKAAALAIASSATTTTPP